MSSILIQFVLFFVITGSDSDWSVYFENKKIEIFFKEVLCDDDNDGQTDEDEISCGSNPKDSNSLSPDFDNDGIIDCLDKDNDGIKNSIDPNPASYDDFLINEFVSDNVDGINDTWKVIKIDAYPNNQVFIYTRTGALIYTSKRYQNNWPSGNQKNEIPSGSYFYKIDLESDGISDKEGWIYLTR